MRKTLSFSRPQHMFTVVLRKKRLRAKIVNHSLRQMSSSSRDDDELIFRCLVDTHRKVEQAKGVVDVHWQETNYCWWRQKVKVVLYTEGNTPQTSDKPNTRSLTWLLLFSTTWGFMRLAPDCNAVLQQLQCPPLLPARRPHLKKRAPSQQIHSSACARWPTVLSFFQCFK